MNKLMKYLPAFLIGALVPTALSMTMNAIGINMGLLPASAITVVTYTLYLFTKHKNRQYQSQVDFQKKLHELRIERDNRLVKLDEKIYDQQLYMRREQLHEEEIKRLDWISRELDEIRKLKQK